MNTNLFSSRVLLLVLLVSRVMQLLEAKDHRIYIPNEHKNSSMFLNSTVATEWSKSTAWELPLIKGVMKGQQLHLRKIDNHPNKWHTCYEVICENTWKNHCPPLGSPESRIDFCYPAIIVTGLPKCGTSAAYDLLKRYSGAITMFEKENCPYTRRRSHWEYFHTLPRAKDVLPGQLLIDGCVDTTNNLRLRRLLHEPETLYLVLTRNFADMLWSSYNFWCKREYDGMECDNTRWVHKHFNRSAELFHDMVVQDQTSVLAPHSSPLHGEMSRPCANAGGYFAEYLQLKVWNDVAGSNMITRGTDRNHTLVVASEYLESNPLLIWSKIATYFNMKERDSSATANIQFATGRMPVPGTGGSFTYGPFVVNDTFSHNYSFRIGNFTQIRTNTQEYKGTDAVIPLKDYRPGVFSISGFVPLKNATRAILDKCWYEDCKYVSALTGYAYAACHPAQSGQ